MHHPGPVVGFEGDEGERERGGELVRFEVEEGGWVKTFGDNDGINTYLDFFER